MCWTLAEIHTEALWSQDSCQRCPCLFLPQPAIKAGPGPEPVHRRLAGPVSQNGPSGLFLALPFPWQLHQPIKLHHGDVARLNWCAFLEARPSGRVLVDLGSGLPSVSWAALVFQLSIAALCGTERAASPMSGHSNSNVHYPVFNSSTEWCPVAGCQIKFNFLSSTLSAYRGESEENRLLRCSHGSTIFHRLNLNKINIIAEKG